MPFSQSVVEDKLSNGVRVVTETLPDRRSVSIGFWVDVGSRDEDESIQGCSHFIEHLLFKGTEKRSAEEISTVIEARGGYLNAFTDRDLTCFTARVLERDTELAVDVISDMLQNSLLKAEDIERERQVVLEEISRKEDTPESLIRDLCTESVWEGNPAGYPVLGTKETVSQLSKDEIEEYFRRHYTPRRIVVAAAGAVNHDDFVGTLERYMTEKREGVPPSRLAPAYRRSVRFFERDTSQVQICIVSEGSAYGDRSRRALTLLSSHLGRGSSSRLFQEVREKKGLVYSIYTHTLSLKDCGLFGVFAGTSRSKVEEVLDITLRELENIRTGGLEPEDLEKVKHKTVGELTLNMESSTARMRLLGVSALRLGRVQTIDEIIGDLEAVTLDEIEALAERIFNRRRVSVIALGLPEDTAAKIEKFV